MVILDSTLQSRLVGFSHPVVRTLRAWVHQDGVLSVESGTEVQSFGALLFPITMLCAQSLPSWKSFLLENREPQGLAVKSNLAVVVQEPGMASFNHTCSLSTQTWRPRGKRRVSKLLSERDSCFHKLNAAESLALAWSGGPFSGCTMHCTV